jgi:hypothetical protein
VFPSGGLALIGTSNKLSRVFSDPAFLLPETSRRCVRRAEMPVAGSSFRSAGAFGLLLSGWLATERSTFLAELACGDSCTRIAQAATMPAQS